ncbi:MAG: HesA/MoeB/ThiF family protein [Verrucomicrobiota bacterium]
MSYLSRIAATYMDTILSEEELIYYAKHILLPGVGAIGQKKLKASRVLVVGAGGLGCPVLQALVGAGVGRVTIVDGDAVTLGNLPRQWLFDANNIGVNKARAAAEILMARNPFIQISAVENPLHEVNAQTLIAEHDLVVDATDELEARYLVDRVCADLDRPWIHGALYRDSGQVCVFWDHCGASYTQLYPEKSQAPDCASAGVLGATASMIGNMQAQEAIKLITGNALPSIGVIRVFNTVNFDLSEMTLPKIRLPALITADLPEDHDYTIGWEQLEQRLSIGEPFRIIDLRSPKAFGEGHFSGAENSSIESILGDLSKFDPSGNCIFYCEEGSLSGLLVNALRSRGLKECFNLQGGYRIRTGSH